MKSDSNGRPKWVPLWTKEGVRFLQCDTLKSFFPLESRFKMKKSWVLFRSGHNLKKKKKKKWRIDHQEGKPSWHLWHWRGDFAIVVHTGFSLLLFFVTQCVSILLCAQSSIIISHNRPPPLYSAPWVSLLYIQLFIKKRETLFFILFRRRTTFVLSAATILCCWPGKVPRVSTSGTTSWTGSSVIISRSLSLSGENKLLADDSFNMTRPSLWLGRTQ